MRGALRKEASKQLPRSLQEASGKLRGTLCLSDYLSSFSLFQTIILQRCLSPPPHPPLLSVLALMPLYPIARSASPNISALVAPLVADVIAKNLLRLTNLSHLLLRTSPLQTTTTTTTTKKSGPKDLAYEHFADWAIARVVPCVRLTCLPWNSNLQPTLLPLRRTVRGKKTARTSPTTCPTLLHVPPV